MCCPNALRPRTPPRVLKKSAAAWLGAAALLAAACGSTQPTIETRPGTRERPQVEASGLHVVTIARATPNLVRLSLWLDAGTRDADPPQLATVSAWAAAERGGPDVRARVLPDGTEFSAECAADRTRECLAGLGRVLSARSVEAPAVTRLMLRLAEQRAKAQVDGRLLAERRALEAALGADADAFFPLGLAENDTRVSSDSIDAFVADHFGPERALLVVAGEIRSALVQEGIRGALSGLPTARTSRASRSLELPDTTTAVRVEGAASGWAAVSVVGHDRADVVRSLAALSQPWSGEEPAARWMVVRGGAVAVASTATETPPEPVRRALSELARTQLPAVTPPASARSDGLDALSESAGLAFCAPDAQPTTVTRVRVGVAATLADEARGGPASERLTAERVQALQQELERTVTEVAQAPSVRGEIGAQAANVVLPNGARVVVQRRDSHNVGIALRFLARTSEETPSTHGRIALLSLLSAQACEGLGAGALGVRLRALGADLRPTLDSNGYGLVLSAPKESWRESLELMSHCALHPLLNRRVFRDAQARMVDALEPQSSRERATTVAAQLTPTRPGAIAPWGSASTSLLDLDAVVRLHREVAVGARVALAIVGDVPVEDVVDVAAHALARLVPGALEPSAAPAATAVGVAALHGEDVPSAIVAFRFDGPNQDATGARAFAALLGHALGRVPAIRVTWLDGGAWSHGAWAAVAVELPLETLETLNVTVASALRALATEAGRRETEQVVNHAVREQVRALAESHNEARWLVTRALEGGETPVERTRVMHTLEALTHTTPHYLVSRGRTAANTTPAASSRP